MKISGLNIALIITVLLVGAVVYFFSQIVTFVIIAWVLSMIGQPLMRFFQEKVRYKRFRLGANISAVFVLLIYLVVIIALVLLFVPLILEQANNLSQVNYDNIAQALEEPIRQFNAWLVKVGLAEDTGQSVDRFAESFRLQEWFKPGEVSEVFSQLVSTAGNLLISIFSIVFVTFFFLKDQGMFVDFICAISPSKYEEKIRNAFASISHLLTRYFGGILVQITIITVFVSLFLKILGIQNALLIGFFAAIINVIPYLGPVIGAVFGLLITISTNMDADFYSQLLPLLTKVAIVFACMQLLDNFILQPWIHSSSVLAHPLEIFLIILMGAQLGGIVGMILAIPSYTVLRVIARGFLSEFRFVQELTESIDEYEYDRARKKKD